MARSGFTSIRDIIFSGHQPDSAIAIHGLDRPPLTYGLLRAQVTEVVRSLNSLGLKRNDRLAVVLPNGPEMAVALLSVSCGFTIVPLNPAYSRQEFESYFSLLEPKALLTQRGFDTHAAEVAAARGLRVIEIVPLPEREAGLFRFPDLPDAGATEPAFSGPDDIACVLLTSGTTAMPKVVRYTHARLSATAIPEPGIAMLASLSKRGTMNVMPLFHFHGLCTILSAMALRKSMACMPGYSSTAFVRWLNEYRPMYTGVGPHILKDMLALASRDPSVTIPRGTTFACGGSSMSPGLVAAFEKRFRTHVVEYYGMTECPLRISSFSLFRRRRPGSIGRPPKGKVAIIDELGNVLPPGTPGEIAGSAACLIPGAEGAQVVNGWYRTGDLGYLDRDGYLFVRGRVKELINCGGEKISPEEIEGVLFSHSSVAEAVVFPVPSDAMGEEPGAAVVLAHGASVTADELRLYLAANLSYFKVPQRIVLVDEIPKGATGKPVRIGLAEKLGLDTRVGMGNCNERNDTVKAPYDEVIATLTTIWEDVLGTSPISGRDNFFFLGGNSIMAAELLARINGLYHTSLPIETVFRSPTIDEMACLLREGNVYDKRVVVPLKESGHGAPLFCIHTIGLQLFSYLGIVNAIGPDQPVYGIQPVGLYGTRKPLDSIEEMAAHYIAEIKKVQPEGPYYLLGYSSAGTIAYEMSVQLSQSGNTVAFTGIVDTPAPGSGYGDLRKTLDVRFLYIAVSQMPHIIMTFAVMPIHEKREQIGYTLAGLRYNAHAAAGALRKMIGLQHRDNVSPVPEGVVRSVMSYQPPKREIYIAQLLALNTYKPKKLKGDIVLFLARPKNITYLYTIYDPAMGWKDHVDGHVEIVRVPGDHGTCIKGPNAALLAEKIAEYTGRPPVGPLKPEMLLR